MQLQLLLLLCLSMPRRPPLLRPLLLLPPPLVQVHALTNISMWWRMQAHALTT